MEQQQAGKEVIVAKLLPNQDLMKFIQFKYKEHVSSFPAEFAICTAIDGVLGAALGAMIGDIVPSIPTSIMAYIKEPQVLAGGPLIQARNFAVLNAANAGMKCIMRRLRGKEDVQTRMVAAFGSAAMFSLVCGVTVIGPLNATNVIGSGLAIALLHGAVFKLEEKFSQPWAPDLDHARARSIPNNPCLQNFEKNFKKGLLTENILPFLPDSALGNVRTPPGPRLYSSRSRQQGRQQKVEEIEQPQGKQGVIVTKPLALLMLFFYLLGRNNY